VTRDTRDEAYLYSAKRKENKMHAELDRLRRELKQRMFTAGPGGETMVAAKPGERSRRLRETAQPKEEAPRTRPGTQSKLDL